MIFAFIFLLLVNPFSQAASQSDYESEIEAVVRNKKFYKADKFEFDVVGGVMPFDSVVSHYTAGGRFLWHFSDHLGWEILDAAILFPSITGFTRDLVASKGLFMVQAPQLKMALASNFMLSPVHGKIRLWGYQVVHFDFFGLVGVGAAKVDTFNLSSSAQGVTGTEIIARSAWDPMFSFGIGTKIFLNKVFGLSLDVRDYLLYTNLYGENRFTSNFAVTLGLLFFIPSFD